MNPPRQINGPGAAEVTDWPWQTWLRLGLCVVSPLAIALIAIAVFRMTNDDFDIGLAPADCGPAGTPGPRSDAFWDALADERRARLLWEASIVCLIFTSLAALAISLWMICASLTGRTRNLLLSGLAALAVMMVGFIWSNDVSLEYTREGILKPTVGRILCQAQSSFTLDHFELSRRLTNSLSTAATIALVFAIIAATQLPLAPRNDGGLAQRAQLLGRRVQRLQVLLYASAAVLVTIVLSMAAWLLWPVALAGSPEVEARLLSVTSGVGLYWGTSFTLVLAAAYLPSALWLSSQVRALGALGETQASTGGRGAQGDSGELRRAALARYGLNRSVFSQVSQLIAIMSPMITGTLPFLDWLA